MALADWAALTSHSIPELRFLLHIPNGGLRPYRVDAKGRRFSPEGNKLKRMGVKKGVPDFQLPVPRMFRGIVRNGLWIEMKSKEGKLTAEQVWWLDELVKMGHCTSVCTDWEMARNVILAYLGMECIQPVNLWRQ